MEEEHPAVFRFIQRRFVVGNLPIRTILTRALLGHCTPIDFVPLAPNFHLKQMTGRWSDNRMNSKNSYHGGVPRVVERVQGGVAEEDAFLVAGVGVPLLSSLVSQPASLLYPRAYEK